MIRWFRDWLTLRRLRRSARRRLRRLLLGRELFEAVEDSERRARDAEPIRAPMDFPRPMSHARRRSEAGQGTASGYVPEWAKPEPGTEKKGR